MKTRRNMFLQRSGVQGATFFGVVRIALFLLGFGFIANRMSALEIDESKLPPPSTAQVEFDRDIRPILEASCFRCHGPERPKSRFRLDNRESALNGGENGVDIIPGQSAKSPLIHYVARLVEDMEMPPTGKGDPLTKEQIGMLRAWIDQGVKWSARSDSESKFLFVASPSIQWITVSGDKRQFREHNWMREGWAGGFEEFRWDQQLSPDKRFSAAGRIFANQHDYQLKLSLEKQDFGFTRFGFEQYRRYYDDTGGFYEPFATNSFSLDRDLSLDIGRVWMDAGLTLPHWPRMTLGYEYQYKDGTKSMLDWSDVYDANGTSAALYPAFKEIDEKAHIIKFDFSHEIKGVLLEDNFRGEFYDLETHRINRDVFSLGDDAPGSASRARERYDHFQAVNAFRLEKQLRDWLFLSGGYLYSKLDADADFDLTAFNFSDPTSVLFRGDVSNQILLERRSHVFNFNTSLGPWDGLIFLGGVQNEWTREEGMTDALVPTPKGANLIMSSDRDKFVVEENFGLRYTKIPATVLFGDVRLQQESIDHYENQNVKNGFQGSEDFLRDTDVYSDLKEFRAGVTLSPWPRLSLHSSYKYRLKQTDYDNLTDTDGSTTPGNGYPAFITARDIQGDEFEAKLSVKWLSWLRTMFKYQLVATDYRTVTDPSTWFFVDPDTFEQVPIMLPGGSIFGGNYDANIYSLNATIIPWRRLYLSTTFSFSDSRMSSGMNGRAGVVPYQGETGSVLTSANFAVTDSMDWHASYTFSRADYRQNKEPLTWPLGIEYDRHGLIAGITRRFKKTLTTRLQYGFFRYDEPSFGGVNNYTAHALFATLTMRLP